MQKLLRSIGIIALLHTGAIGQNWGLDTAFHPMTTATSAAPVTYHNSLKVISGRGSAQIKIPLGPGIGTRGAEFKPAFHGVFSPIVRHLVESMSPVSGNTCTTNTSKTATWWATLPGDTAQTSIYAQVTSSGILSMSPGHFSYDPISMLRGGQYILPSGERGSVQGNPESYIATQDIIYALQSFGYSADQIFYWPLPSAMDPNIPASIPYLMPCVRTLDGALVVPLKKGTNRVACTNYGTYTPCEEYPGAVLVIKGDQCVEFDSSNPHILLPPISVQGQVNTSVNYMPVEIRNRIGDKIIFKYWQEPNVYYTASWYKKGQTQSSGVIRVVEQGTEAIPATLALRSNGPSAATSAKKIRIEYSFTSETRVSPITILAVNCMTTSDPLGPLPCESAKENFYAEWFQPISITQDSNGESVAFKYGSISVPLYQRSGSINSAVLSSVVYGNGRRMDLAWEAYQYVPLTSLSGWRWGGVSSGFGDPKELPAYSAGVSMVQDRDTIFGVTRTTKYTRKVPTPEGPFWEVIEHPDGSADYYAFAQLVSKDATGWASQENNQEPRNVIQNMAALKHGVVERRRYFPGGLSWRDDGPGGSPGYSSATWLQVFDRWDIRRIGNQTGSINSAGAPYPTRIRTLNRLQRTLTIEELQDWDGSGEGRGWKWQTRSVFDRENFGGYSFDPISLAQQGISRQSASVYGIPVVARGATKAFVRNDILWTPARISSNQQQQQGGDTTGYFKKLDSSAENNSVFEGPLEQFEYSAGVYDTPSLRKLGASLQLEAKFEIHDNGPAQGLPSKGILTSTPVLGLSGSAGVAYGYDSLGTLNSIQQTGASWHIVQESDALGRPTSRKDENGFATTYAWTESGLLNGTKLSSGELGVDYSYDSDFRGIVEKRGTVQEKRFRFNPFGELVRLARANGDGTWSHQKLGYDAAGRKIWETVWQQGEGDDSGWNNPIPPGPASSWSYDARGRVVKQVDPNGILLETQWDVNQEGAYDGRAYRRIQYPTVRGVSTKTVTQFTNDALGRHVKVQDPLQGTLEFFYDHLDRLTQVRQSPKSGEPASPQIRTWERNELGWLTALTTPESGRTTFSDFTVFGSPQIITYGAGSSSPRVIRRSYDPLGRPLHLKSDDGSLEQYFLYDQSKGHGPWPNGKLTSATDKGVHIDYVFAGLGGRLSQMSTSILDAAGPGSGVVDTHVQSFSYDPFGHRIASSVDGREYQHTYDLAKSMSKSVGKGGISIASADLDPYAWNIKSLSFGTVGVASTFTYGLDQRRLASMTHLGNGISKSWNYAFDPTGRLLSDGEDSYQYDELGRLIKAEVKRLDPNSTVTQWFKYDSFGNQTSSQSTSNTPLPSSITNFEFNSGDESLSARNQIPQFLSNGAATGRGYDPQGHLTHFWSKPGDGNTQIALGHDASGRVLEMSDSLRGILERYSYSHTGLRTIIDEFQNGTWLKRKIFIHNDLNQLVSEYEFLPNGGE